MAPLLIDLRAAEDIRDVVLEAAQRLAQGRLVVFPTETVYGIAARALDAQAVDRLVEVKGRKAGHAVTLAIRSADEARDFVPDLPALAHRLARRCWPGPITLVVRDSHPESMVARLPESVRQIVAPQGTVGLRVPGHTVILDVLQMMAGPLVLTSANRSGQPEARTGTEAAEALGDDVDLVLDDGPSRFGQPSSVVRVDGNKYELLRTGAVPEKTLRRLASAMVLFVCTGNTCRSPMAEMLFRKLAAERLGCDPSELEDRGLMVLSAGIAAMAGGRAAAEACDVLRGMGLDLSMHETQPLTEPLVRHADAIYTMTRSQRAAIIGQWPQAAERCRVLSSHGGDISDPIGGPVERYQRCAEQIQAELKARVDELEL